jgi:hypothetical protein
VSFLEDTWRLARNTRALLSSEGKQELCKSIYSSSRPSSLRRLNVQQQGAGRVAKPTIRHCRKSCNLTMCILAVQPCICSLFTQNCRAIPSLWPCPSQLKSLFHCRFRSFFAAHQVVAPFVLVWRRDRRGGREISQRLEKALPVSRCAANDRAGGRRPLSDCQFERGNVEGHLSYPCTSYEAARAVAITTGI